eukprot:Partr_v1_DN24279_c0_g2_i1_m36880 putative farnesyl pyrophosphate
MTIDQESAGEQFAAVFPKLAAEVLADIKALDFPVDAVAYVETMLNYTVPGGKMNRGLSVYHSFRLLKPDHTRLDQEKADILGWCVEWLQAFFLVADDIMDHSKTRRGQPCWYLRENVGNVAINDSFLLETFIYRILRKHFCHDPFYGQLLDLFHEVSYQTELGQLMDLLTAPEDSVDLNRFDMQRYQLIVQYKTAYYSFYMPVALAMLLAGVKEETAYEQAREILVPMGVFFQVQDDYLDCFGTPEKIGKIGTDIQDNKCSWLVVQALKLASPADRRVLEENYGKKNDEEAVERVKALYRQLDLPRVYREYEDKSYREIEALIAGVDASLVPHRVYQDFAAKIYKRDK